MRNVSATIGTISKPTLARFWTRMAWRARLTNNAYDAAPPVDSESYQLPSRSYCMKYAKSALIVFNRCVLRPNMKPLFFNRQLNILYLVNGVHYFFKSDSQNLITSQICGSNPFLRRQIEFIITTRFSSPKIIYIFCCFKNKLTTAMMFI